MDLILLGFLCLTVVGCKPDWNPPKSARPHTRSIVVDHQTPGTHLRLEVDGEVWYQLVGCEVLALDHRGRIISRTRLAPVGSAPSATDLVLVGDTLAVLLGDSEVVELDVADPWRPTVVDRFHGEDIGVWPKRLGVRGDDVIVMGEGSARTLDGRIVARAKGPEITGLVEHGGRVLHVAGRRIHRRAGDAYVGTASLLELADPHRLAPEAAFLYARNERNGGLVGFLGADCREVNAERLTVGVPGTVSRLRQRNGQVLAVTDEGLFLMQLTADGLTRVWDWQTPDVRDADWIDGGHVAVAGTFGTGVVPVGATDPSSSAIVWNPSAGGLTEAASDGEVLRGRSSEGEWVYEIGGDVTQFQGEPKTFPSPSTTAAALGWSISIDPSGVAEIESPAGPHRLEAPVGGRFHCIASTGDSFWLGHDRGILLISLRSVEGSPEVIESSRLGVMIDGPVICIEPLVLGGGVAYASAHGGFGVVREVF